jgi:hypothetical protein
MTLRVRSVPALLCAGALVAACGGSDDESATTASVSVSSPNPDVTQPSTITPTAPTSTTAAPATVAPLAGASIAEFEILGGPDWLVADEHGVWVKVDTGIVVLIDPTANLVADEVLVDGGGALCQGLGAGGGSIWSCTEEGIARIDPRVREVSTRIRASKAYSQGELVVTEGQMWLLTGDGSVLEGIDVTTGHVWSRFELPVRGTDLDAGAAGLWVVSTVDDAVVQVDPASGDIERTVAVEAPLDVAVDHEVWVGAAADTVRINLASGATDLRVPIGTGTAGSVALTPTEVWIRGADPFLVRADRATGAVVEEFAADVASGGDLLYAFGSIWTTAFDDARLFRFAAA